MKTKHRPIKSRFGHILLFICACYYLYNPTSVASIKFFELSKKKKIKNINLYYGLFH